MAGIFARARSIARSQYVAPSTNNSYTPPDNYATYINRIEAAQSSMREKREQQYRRIQFLQNSLEVEEEGMNQWGNRVAALEATLDCYAGDTKGYEGLAHLYDTAKTMYTAFLNKVEAIEASIAELQAQQEPLVTHINQLTAAKTKLMSAQSVEQARGTMDRILTSSISPGNRTPASFTDDQELRSIRRLIAESEALAELKG